MDPLRKGIAIGMLFGSGGTDAELHDKEIEIETSDIRESQTAIFEYDPADEDPSGDPPGPWDGYSLFTIDLSNVQEDLEDLEEQISDLEDCKDSIIELLQTYHPGFDPQSCQDIADQIEQDEEDREDAEEEAEECSQCKAAVILAIQAILPNFDPQTCKDMVDAIEEVYEQGEEDAPEEYTFPQDPNDPTKPTLEDVTKLTATDPVGIEGNSYYFVYKSRISFDRGVTWTDYSIYDTVTNVDTAPYYAVYTCKAYVYEKATGNYVTELVLLGVDGGNIDIGGYFKITSLMIDYTNKTMISTWENRIWSSDPVRTGTKVNDISAYLDTTSPNPHYKVTKSS